MLPIFLLLAFASLAAARAGIDNPSHLLGRARFHSQSTARSSGRQSRRLQAQECQKSSLSGFNYSIALQEGIFLHWVPHASSIDFALEASKASGASTGWLAVGWSPTSQMVGSDAVIGNLPGNGVAGYYLGDTDISGFVADDVLAANSYGSTATATGTLIWFSRRYNQGKVPILAQGDNYVIYAYSADGTQKLAYHDLNYGYATVDFSCGKSFPSAPPPAPATTPPLPPGKHQAPPVTPSLPPPQSQPPPVTPAASPPSPSPSPSPPAASACTPSSLSGYTCQVQLNGNSFLLHWALDSASNAVHLAAQAATSGWVSIGWSKDGHMPSSDAAIGNLPAGINANGAAVGAYYLADYSLGSITQSSAVTLTATSVTVTNGQTTIKFTRQLSAGFQPMSSNAASTVIWAYSDDNSQTLSFHGANKGSLSVNFATGQSAASSVSESNYLVWHGVLLALSFGILMPLAILIARIFLADVPRNQTPDIEPLTRSPFLVSLFSRPWEHRPFWFTMHQVIQILAVLVAIGGVVIPFVVTGTRGLKKTHGILGLAVIGIVLLQPILGFLRPKPKSSARLVWYAAHWVIGLTAVGLAWLNINYGLDLYQAMYSSTLQQAYKVTMVAIAGTMFVVYIVVVTWDLCNPKSYTKQALSKSADRA